MITDTRERIIEYITYHGQARAYDLQKALQISSVAIHKQLNKLLREGLVIRVGRPPLVLYVLPQQQSASISGRASILSATTAADINAHFLSITPDGRLLYGMEGFDYWARMYQKNKPIVPIAEE